MRVNDKLNIASYLYVVKCFKDFKLRIKSLGKVVIESGVYVYVGSANIRKPYLRILRHLSKNFEKPLWHIDYITINCQPKLGILCYGINENSMWEYVVKHKDMFTPYLKRFGASDTPYHYTHLFKVVLKDLNVCETIVKTLLRSKTCSYIEVVFP